VTGQGGGFRLGEEALAPARLRELARDPGARLHLTAEVRTRLEAGRREVDRILSKGGPLYGANTAYGGDASPRPLEGEALEGLQHRLARYLDTGSGPPLSGEVARGVLLARAHVLARGHSGVGPELVEALVALFQAGIAPLLPSRGSLGASGDLVTLAPLALLLAGEAPAEGIRLSDGSRLPAGVALAEAGLAPRRLEGRDTLALINGLSGAAALAAFRVAEARNLLAWAEAGVAAAGWALGVRGEAWGPEVNEAPVRRHRGQGEVARRLRRWLGEAGVPEGHGVAGDLQDPYSLRCAPQLLGPVWELLELADAWVAAELDGVSDNPVLGVEGGPRSGGNFFGGYLAGAAELTAGALARMGDLLERQTFLLVEGRAGLPVNLTGGEASGHHGLKGVHQAASALAMELQRGAIPSSPFARSAEGHNQDVVSNAMNGALVLDTQVEVAAALVAGHATLAAQAVAFRRVPLPEALAPWMEEVQGAGGGGDDDRSLRLPLAALASRFLDPP
jgi:histidine ammonia-lyase